MNHSFFSMWWGKCYSWFCRTSWRAKKL